MLTPPSGARCQNSWPCFACCRAGIPQIFSPSFLGVALWVILCKSCSRDSFVTLQYCNEMEGMDICICSCVGLVSSIFGGGRVKYGDAHHEERPSWLYFYKSTITHLKCWSSRYCVLSLIYKMPVCTQYSSHNSLLPSFGWNYLGWSGKGGFARHPWLGLV